MKKTFVVILCVLIVLVLISTIGFLFGYSYYKEQIGPVTKECQETIAFEVKQGDTFYSLAPRLKSMGLINSEDMYKIYLKLNKPEGLLVGRFKLNSCYSVEKIIEILQGKTDKKDRESTDIVITFTEGKNMRSVAKTIASNTNNTEDDVYALLKDETYLKELINTYWFLDDTILNKKIYYSLEGYLYPNTYNFKDKNVTVKEIFKKLLDETSKQLEPYRQEIEKSKYSVHEILTFASIVELEAGPTYRPEVAGVFYNRLNNKISLGSDVTTYYGAKVDMAERDLYNSEIIAINDYNTRPTSFLGLPIGPICNPSVSSIKAVLNPKKTDAFYFVSDNTGKIYFSKTLNEQNQTIAKLKREGSWERY